MLCGETVAVYCENRTEHNDTLCGKNAELRCINQVVRIVTTALYTVLLLFHNFCEKIPIHQLQQTIKYIIANETFKTRIHLGNI
jgi:hypothetical protein